MLKKYIFKHKFFIKVLYEDYIKLEFIKSYVFTNVLILKKIWIVKFLTKVNIYVENKKILMRMVKMFDIWNSFVENLSNLFV